VPGGAADFDAVLRLTNSDIPMRSGGSHRIQVS